MNQGLSFKQLLGAFLAIVSIVVFFVENGDNISLFGGSSNQSDGEVATVSSLINSVNTDREGTSQAQLATLGVNSQADLQNTLDAFQNRPPTLTRTPYPTFTPLAARATEPPTQTETNCDSDTAWMLQSNGEYHWKGDTLSPDCTITVDGSSLAALEAGAVFVVDLDVTHARLEICDGNWTATIIDNGEECTTSHHQMPIISGQFRTDNSAGFVLHAP